MRKVVVTILLFVSLSANSVFAEDYDYVENMFDIRTAITEQGKILPQQIENSAGNDIRTLERVFELNTSVLTTIEAYFRILKIAVTSGSETSDESVKILNGWLDFMSTQCKYDIEFLEEALKETQDIVTMQQIATAKANISRLSVIVEDGLDENRSME